MLIQLTCQELRLSEAETPIGAAVFDQRKHDIFGRDPAALVQILGHNAIESLLHLLRTRLRRHVDQDALVAAIKTKPRILHDKAIRLVFSHDLVAVAERNFERVDHRTMDRVEQVGNLGLRPTLDDMDVQQWHGGMILVWDLYFESEWKFALMSRRKSLSVWQHGEANTIIGIAASLGVTIGNRLCRSSRLNAKPFPVDTIGDQITF